LRVKLRHLDEWNRRRKQASKTYLAALAASRDLTLPFAPPELDPAWHLFVVQHPRRDALQEHLQKRGVGTLIHYPVPPHLCPAYAELGLAKGTFPITEMLAQRALSLPLGPHLTAEQSEAVIGAVREFAS
jgi:dTDP-4-amino-4,6-dideoxygalactose transaminase